ncbi:MAG: ATP-dependent DNA ligase [Acidobacteriota bacterium]
MQLRDLVGASEAVTATSSRLKKIEYLANALRRADPDEVETVVAFLSSGPRQGRIGIGMAAIRAAMPETAADRATLTVRDVDTAFSEIAGMSGTLARTSRLRALFARSNREEQRFLSRLLFGELRQGALEGVLLEAVARAANVPAEAVRRATMLAGDLRPVARAALAEGSAGLVRFSVRLFQPIQPMLAETAASLDEAIDVSGAASVEMKLDGARIQVHKQDDEVRVYSRNLRDVTESVPEVVDLVRVLPARSVILDGEAISLKPNGAPQPFQLTMRRFGRRSDDAALRTQLPLTPLFFDVVLVDADPVLDEPLARRLDLLHAVVPGSNLVPHLREPSAADADAFLSKVLAQGHEGLMVKSLAAPYAAGRRGQAWLKVKQARTLDLVILAVEWGSGRRQGWLSNLHLGARDPERNAFVMLGKTFKGLTDEVLAWQTRRFLQLEIGRDDYTVYVKPEVVVEIAFNDLQESPHYPGGLALRFARVKRYRTDKTAAEADTFATVQQIYREMTGREPPATRL